MRSRLSTHAGRQGSELDDMEGEAPPCDARIQELAALLTPEGSCERVRAVGPAGLGSPGLVAHHTLSLPGAP